jgi:hypothetical protein
MPPKQDWEKCTLRLILPAIGFSTLSARINDVFIENLMLPALMQIPRPRSRIEERRKSKVLQLWSSFKLILDYVPNAFQT